MSANLTAEGQERGQRQEARLRAYVRAQIARLSDQQMDERDDRIRGFAERLTGTRVDMAQMRNLETLAYTTDKVSDITDLVKRSIGRDLASRGWARDNIGVDVLTALEALRADAKKVVAGLRDEFSDLPDDDDLVRRVHLELCREFAMHLTAEFLYRKAIARQLQGAGRND